MNTITEVPGYQKMKEELATLELEVLTEGYTLADAIREGSKYTKQATGKYIDSEQNEVCALSAAALAVQARFNA